MNCVPTYMVTSCILLSSLCLLCILTRIVTNVVFNIICQHLYSIAYFSYLICIYGCVLSTGCIAPCLADAESVRGAVPRKLHQGPVSPSEYIQFRLHIYALFEYYAIFGCTKLRTCISMPFKVLQHKYAVW